MTVKELRERLSQYEDDVKIYLYINDITDNYGYIINSTATAEAVVEGIEHNITICGSEN